MQHPYWVLAQGSPSREGESGPSGWCVKWGPKDPASWVVICISLQEAPHALGYPTHVMTHRVHCSGKWCGNLIRPKTHQSAVQVSGRLLNSNRFWSERTPQGLGEGNSRIYLLHFWLILQQGINIVISSPMSTSSQKRLPIQSVNNMCCILRLNHTLYWINCSYTIGIKICVVNWYSKCWWIIIVYLVSIRYFMM